jgi:hypothetical protein
LILDRDRIRGADSHAGQACDAQLGIDFEIHKTL